MTGRVGLSSVIATRSGRTSGSGFAVNRMGPRWWSSSLPARRSEERRYELIKEEFLAECRLRSLEPPSADQADRYVRSALVLYAYGTGAGIRAVAAGEHGHTEHHLYYVRRWPLSRGLVEALARPNAHPTFAA